MTSRMPAWRRYLRFGGADVRADVDDEIAFHIETTAVAFIASGESPEQARRRAVEEFGNLRAARTQCYSIGERRRRRHERSELFTALGQDVRYAVRVLRDSPAFTVGVVIMIAIAMAVNAAAFAVIDSMLLRPPAYMIAPGETHHVYEFSRLFRDRAAFGPTMSYRRYEDLLGQTHAFATMAAVHERQSAIRVGRASDLARVAFVTANFWSLFDATPAVGRYFAPSDEAEGARPMVAVLSYDFWQSRLHGDSDVVGTSLSMGSASYRIVGVAPPRFTGVALAAPAAFIPLLSSPELAASFNVESYMTSWLDVIARRRPGWSVERATYDLDAALRWSATRQRTTVGARQGWMDASEIRGLLGPIKVDRGPLHTPESRVALWLAGLAGVVLLVAALNVANLMLARLLRRRREIAVRLALGVSAMRLVRLLLTEATIVVLGGAASSLALVWWFGDPLLRRVLPNTHLPPIEVDARIIAFTMATALCAALIIGVAPALRALQWNVVVAISDGGAAAGLRHSRMRGTLTVLQTAFSLALLVCAGLFVQSLRNIHALPLGYEPHHVLVVQTLDGETVVPGVPQALAQTMLLRAESIDGIEAGALSASLPFVMHIARRFDSPNAARPARGQFAFDAVSPGYFHTVGTRVIAGREFDARDDATAPPVAMVTAPMAARLWPGESAIGKCLTSTNDGRPCARIIGIVEPVREWGYTDDEMLVYYGPLAQARGFMRTNLLLRTTSDASAVAARVRRALEADAPENLRIIVAPMQDALDLAAQSWRIGATTLSFLAAIALGLAAVGIYGVVAYEITERQRDVSIRVALGASAASLVRSGVARVIGVGLVGVAAGTLLSLVLGPAIGTLLFGVSGRDPTTLVTAGVVTLTAFGVASAVPVLRAARADPATILRSG
jgi:putative ABC transport system permease protein